FIAEKRIRELSVPYSSLSHTTEHSNLDRNGMSYISVESSSITDYNNANRISIGLSITEKKFTKTRLPQLKAFLDPIDVHIPSYLFYTIYTSNHALCRGHIELALSSMENAFDAYF
ncbi:hypothetical protein Tcan_00663, partial [Toxocara canis]